MYFIDASLDCNATEANANLLLQVLVCVGLIYGGK